MFIPNREVFLPIAAGFAASACIVSFWLIFQHQQHMSNLNVQSKTVGIIWMIPIYAVDSFLSLWMPSVADYVNMLRDCYEAYVLYLFLSLMLSYLGCEEEEGEYYLIAYLEKQPGQKKPFPFNYVCPQDLPRGKEFLRYCKFGTLQYCVVRPATTFAAIVMHLSGWYDESHWRWNTAPLYVLIIINISVGYAFIVLASFYTVMKKKLKPYAPVGKFLCIKFVIFFAFWQVSVTERKNAIRMHFTLCCTTVLYFQAHAYPTMSTYSLFLDEFYILTSPPTCIVYTPSIVISACTV